LDVKSAFLNGLLKEEVYVTQPPGFEKCKVEYGVYVKEENGDIIILCLYVDDLLITGGNEVVIQTVKKQLQQEFDMIDLGVMSYFLGIEFIHSQEWRTGDASKEVCIGSS